MFITILGVIFHYGITIGRNLKAKLLGYGLYIGVSVLMLALRPYAPDLIDTFGRALLFILISPRSRSGFSVYGPIIPNAHASLLNLKQTTTLSP